MVLKLNSQNPAHTPQYREIVTSTRNPPMHALKNTKTRTEKRAHMSTHECASYLLLYLPYTFVPWLNQPTFQFTDIPPNTCVLN